MSDLEVIVKDFQARQGYASMCAYYINLDDYVKSHMKDGHYKGDVFKLMQHGKMEEIMKRAYAKIHTHLEK